MSLVKCLDEYGKRFVTWVMKLFPATFYLQLMAALIIIPAMFGIILTVAGILLWLILLVLTLL